MNFSFFITCLLQVFILIWPLCPVVFGEIICDRNLQSNERFVNFNESKATLNESNYEIGVDGEKSPWFLNIPLLPIMVANSNSIPEGSCKKQLQLYLNHLKNGTLWATEMFDSSAKYPYGLFDGLTRHLGSFDQCKRIQATIINTKNGDIETISSRYCLVDVKFEDNNKGTFTGAHEKYLNPLGSAWEAIFEKGHNQSYAMFILQMALCFPAKCQTEEIVTILKEPLDEFGRKYNIQVKASISPMYCASAEAQSFSNFDIIFYSTCLLILSLVIISTAIDLNSKKPKELSLLYCFSARRNMNELFRINYRHRGLDSIHFIRILLTVIAVFAHRQLQYMYAGNISAKYLQWFTSDLTFGIFHNVPIIVDGFFGVGGLLLSYYLLDYLNESKIINIMLLVIKRLVRLLPVYMFVTFGYTTIFHRLGSGPFWESTMGFSRDSCSSNWWTNLFFINNYFGGNNKCIIQSWYLAVDFQCYLIGLLLIIAFNKMPRKIGYTFLGCICIFSAIVPFYLTYKNNLVPLVNSIANPRRIENSHYFLNYYIKTHMRSTAYIVGLILGAFIYDYKKANWRLSKTWSNILFITTFVIMFSTVYIGTLLLNPNLKISVFYKALYTSLHRPIFAFSICAIPLLLTIGNGLGFYYNLLTSRWMQPLSRISYGIFLIHFVIHHFEIGTTRTAFTFSLYNVLKYLVSDLVYSVCLALFLAIVIEFPFRNILNVIIERKSIVTNKKSPSSIIQTKEE
ncbi:O-acyltransferase like protein-like [Leptopilina heterotoma]|uniref:O-acyltransferase like protein-like n=1 Tax=Leptopilina heterotoma TaxID=63436 RepID=UPI001CA9A5B9|nr:O-acyltransferase like protein-like [Leptopilina heterotoma]